MNNKMNNRKDLDPRIIYFFVLVALALPLIFNYTLKPAKLDNASKLFDIVDNLQVQKGEVAFLAFDFGPNTKAENETQAKVILEHLFRKRVPVVLFSLVAVAEPFLKNMPENIASDLEQEFNGQFWQYGKDWVNLGYQPGASLLIQAIPKSNNLRELFKTDVNGNSLANLDITKDFDTIEKIKFLGQFTGYVGMVDRYLEFFKTENYKPLFGHGCTSITIPEAYIYLDSGQLNGLLEGIAGAAWYSHLLSERYVNRKTDSAQVINTGLGVAHLVIILFIILGNILMFKNLIKK